MNETNINEVVMDNIETAVELDMDNLIPIDYEVVSDGFSDEDNIGKIILGLCAAAGVVIGGVAIAKKKKKDGDKKEGFFTKLATKYLTKNGYKVEQVETEDVEGNDEDDFDGLIPDKK